MREGNTVLVSFSPTKHFGCLFVSLLFLNVCISQPFLLLIILLTTSSPFPFSFTLHTKTSVWGDLDYLYIHIIPGAFIKCKIGNSTEKFGWWWEDFA